jgi:hypothetical protein
MDYAASAVGRRPVLGLSDRQMEGRGQQVADPTKGQVRFQLKVIRKR